MYSDTNFKHLNEGIFFKIRLISKFRCILIIEKLINIIIFTKIYFQTIKNLSTI